MHETLIMQTKYEAKNFFIVQKCTTDSQNHVNSLIMTDLQKCRWIPSLYIQQNTLHTKRSVVWLGFFLTLRRLIKFLCRLSSDAGLPSSTAKHSCSPSLSLTSSSLSRANIASCSEGIRTSSMWPWPWEPSLLGAFIKSSTMARVSGVMWSLRDGEEVRAIMASVYCWISR